MHKEEVNKLVEHYSEMSDEELSHLIITRLDSLTEAARQALSIVVNSRDLTAFDNELNATFNDAKSQFLLAQKEQQRPVQERTDFHPLIRYSCLVIILLGGVIMLSDADDFGWDLVTIAGGILVFSELIHFSRMYKKAFSSTDSIKSDGAEVSVPSITEPEEPKQDSFVAIKEKLMVVVRPCFDYLTHEDSFVPFKPKLESDDGKVAEALGITWYKTIGDLHVRFVFDDVQLMRHATILEINEFALNFEQALQLALKNIHSTYGKPEVSVWQEGIFNVHGKSDDFNSSYFLDRDFWSSLLLIYPEGIVAAIPIRGGLLFAPFANNYAVQVLSLNIASLVESFPEQLRISSLLYLFKEGVWSIFQPIDQSIDSSLRH